MILFSILAALRANLKKEEGQGLAEYALILVLISIAAIAIMALLGGKIGSVFTSISAAL